MSGYAKQQLVLLWSHATFPGSILAKAYKFAQGIAKPCKIADDSVDFRLSFVFGAPARRCSHTHSEIISCCEDDLWSPIIQAFCIKPTGNIDRDFVAAMVSHHQGAIDMAKAELRYGREAQLRRSAREIIVDQIQQISLMRLAAGEPLPPSVSSPTDRLSQPLAGRGSKVDPLNGRV
jgi:hypothetical protein